MSLQFKKAERRQTKLKIALAGPSGSGKTMSALRLAKGIGGRVAVVDTENGTASLYSDRFEFDILELDPPYSVDKYIQAFNAAREAGYDVLIVDSISHQWAGEGGILNKKEQLDSRGGNSFANWAKLTPEQERFKSAILHADIHMICTMRAKQEYALQADEKGRTTVQKLGLAPIQREGMEYEFTTMFDVAMDHRALASKDRTGLFDGKIEMLTEDTGKRFMTWLSSAKPFEPARKSRDELNRKLMDMYPKIMKASPKTNFQEILVQRYNVSEIRLCTVEQLADLVKHLEGMTTTAAPIGKQSS